MQKNHVGLTLSGVWCGVCGGGCQGVVGGGLGFENDAEEEREKGTVVLSETKQSQLDEQKTNKRKGYGSEKTV